MNVQSKSWHVSQLRSLCCKLARNCQLLYWHRAHMHLNADQFDALSAVVTHSCHECDDDAKHMTAMPARGRRGDSVVAVALP